MPAKKYSLEWWASLPPEKVGKESEKLVEALLSKWNQSMFFAWHRLPDSKAARGVLKAQPADFIYTRSPHFGYIEVKALKHLYRLPADRLTQLPVLHKWSMAGAHNLLLVNHYMSGKWRAIKVDALPFGATSWDLSGFPEYDSAEAALRSTGWFEGICDE